MKNEHILLRIIGTVLAFMGIAAAVLCFALFLESAKLMDVPFVHIDKGKPLIFLVFGLVPSMVLIATGIDMWTLPHMPRTTILPTWIMQWRRILPSQANSG